MRRAEVLTRRDLRDASPGKRQVPDGLRKILNWDAEFTNQFADFARKVFPNATKSETKFMEISCSGFVWLPACVILYLMEPLVPKQLSVNLLMALLLDVIVIGLVKAFARRRRPPTKKADYFKSIGPDQYSFPSGHASRSVLLTIIFTSISPLFDAAFLHLLAVGFLWTWSATVCISRLLNGRHYLLDVVAGIVIGFVEGYLLSFLWMSSQRAENILNFFSEEAPEFE